MNEETFKIIPHFPDYLVSNYGRVKTRERKIRYTHAKTGNEHFRIKEEVFLKCHANHLTGYKFHQLYKNKKMYNRPIHNLVGHAFLPNPNNYPCINHRDGNKHNNVTENLEWCTNAYNHEHATKTGLKPFGSRIGTSKLNEKMVHAIKWFLNKGISHSELSQAFKVSRSTISLIKEEKIWKRVALTGTELIINLEAQP